MREQNTAALVIPAHTLKGEARQLGAEPLAKIAELIETTARFCVESRRFPDELVPEVVELRRLFDSTVELVRQGDQSADDPRRAGRLRPQGEQPELRPDLIFGSSLSAKPMGRWQSRVARLTERPLLRPLAPPPRDLRCVGSPPHEALPRRRTILLLASSLCSWT